MNPRVGFACRGRGGPAFVGRPAPRTISLLLRPAPRPRPRPRPRPAPPSRGCLRAGGPSPPCSVAAAGTRSRAVLAFVRGPRGALRGRWPRGAPRAACRPLWRGGRSGVFFARPPPPAPVSGPCAVGGGRGFSRFGSALGVARRRSARRRSVGCGDSRADLGSRVQNPKTRGANWCRLSSLRGGGLVCRGGHRTPRVTARARKYCMLAPRVSLWARVGFVGSS